MSIIDELIYDRTASDRDEIVRLNRIGWEAMTEAEQKYWAEGVSPLVATDGALTVRDGALYVFGGGVVRGAYNAIDVNRVERAVAYMAELLETTANGLKEHAEAMGVAWDALFDVPYDGSYYSPAVKTDWSEENIPGTKDMNRYLGNVRHIITAIEADYPELPESMNNLTYIGANAIERSLYVLYTVLLAEEERIEKLLDNTAAIFVYSGQPYSGMVWTQIGG